MVYENLASVLKEYGVSYTPFHEAGISRSYMSRIINSDEWPKRKSRDLVEEIIKKVLTENDVPAGVISGIWQVPEKSQPAQRLNRRFVNKLLLGGPVMLQQEVLNKIGCYRDPFWNEIGGLDDLFPNPEHDRIMNIMLDAATNQKLLAMHGQVGAGKTIIQNRLLLHLDDQMNFRICEPRISEKAQLRPATLVDAMIHDFVHKRGSLSNDRNRLEVPRKLEEKDRRLANILFNNQNEGKNCVLIIDEAHDLPIETLKTIKRLYEIQHRFKKLLGIILIGQPELADRFNDYRVREVSARVNLEEIKPVRIQTGAYVQHKIERAGGQFDKLFDQSAIIEIERKLANERTPLALNIMASKALKRAYKLGQFPVTGEIVDLAFRKES